MVYILIYHKIQIYSLSIKGGIKIPFKKVNPTEELEKLKKEDKECAEHIEKFESEYEEIMRVRKSDN